VSEKTGHDEHEDLRMAKAVGRGVVLGLPIALIGLTLVVKLITGQDMADSFATSVLPGTLLGVFFGGFVGMVKNMG
jgi:ABC-type Mn2+/Zn2+ transport system permease subunit